MLAWLVEYIEVTGKKSVWFVECVEVVGNLFGGTVSLITVKLSAPWLPGVSDLDGVWL